MYGSSTAQLSNRYRHLFVLPSLPTLAILLCLSTLGLTGIITFYERLSLALVVASVLSALLSGLIVDRVILRMDPKSIISTRRFFGLLLVSTLIWMVPVLISLPVSPLLKNAIVNEFVFGAFLAWGFELVIINGAFIRSAPKSLLISAIHPVPILLLVLSEASHDQLYSPISGVIVLAIMLLFLSRVNSIKTRKGVPSLDILRAFLKTWVEGKPDDLETYFAGYAQPERVITDLVIARSDGSEVILVLPGIHPGPFSPVGSYNLSELIYTDLKAESVMPVVLHGTGGHERNVPTNKIASDYAKAVALFVSAQKDAKRMPMKGPYRSKVGITTITTIGFQNQVLAVVSNSPYRSDDFDPGMIADAYAAATEIGLNVMVVDAHNSVDGQDEPQQRITKDEWTAALRDTLQLKENDFRMGAANSGEIQFKHANDISDGGISLVIFATAEAKWALVSADSNNAKSGLKEKLATELGALGINLVELCTSDTHKLAARNRTSRGYFALGEQTDFKDIVKCVKELAVLAEHRLAVYDLQIARFESDVPLIGSESLDDFAALTKSTISISREYTKIILPALLILLTVTLFY